jgi:hypothetical protein
VELDVLGAWSSSNHTFLASCLVSSLLNNSLENLLVASLFELAPALVLCFSRFPGRQEGKYPWPACSKQHLAALLLNSPLVYRTTNHMLPNVQPTLSSGISYVLLLYVFSPLRFTFIHRAAQREDFIEFLQQNLLPTS